MGKTRSNFYVVWNGRTNGVFDSWEECSKQVSGFPNSSFKGYKTKEEAEWAYIGWLGKYEDMQNKANRPDKVTTKSMYQILPEGIIPELITKSGRNSVKLINTKTRQQYFETMELTGVPFELLDSIALIFAIINCWRKKLPIYTDSLIAKKHAMKIEDMDLLKITDKTVSSVVFNYVLFQNLENGVQIYTLQEALDEISEKKTKELDGN